MDFAILDIAARWLHISSVVLWIGHNWSNVVHTPAYRRVLPEDPPEAIHDVFVATSKREHGIFRYAALVVWATGLVMLWYRHEIIDAFTLSGKAILIGLGAWTGTAMVLNLWLIMWPHQKKVLGFVEATVEERLRCTRVTFLSSRTNSFLAAATVFLMIAGAHGTFLFA
ncbi:urate hydroxylase PuuD [Methylovirgula sp. HY1]|uniref:urate hydroxylase PuuD n=1 Tax=Methylovirgula sp. HY1 TaxID=2822761 RepID=UPI001C5B254F|nr:urate hydroxylase PuuD [Methylovirgula sp. HY1]QXX76628.1 hypothetical protein MHY1_p00150 [Methylovirgula sp. HY1]